MTAVAAAASANGKNENDDIKWVDAIASLMKNGDKTINVKKLRKQTLLSLQLDTDDKSAKKAFKKTVQKLEENGKLSLDAEGTIRWKGLGDDRDQSKSSKKKKDKKKKKKKRKENEQELGGEHGEERDTKRQKPSSSRNVDGNDDKDDGDNNNNNSDNTSGGADDKEGETGNDTSGSTEHDKDEQQHQEQDQSKNKPVAGNPQGVTRLFVGNLPFAVDETSLGEFFYNSVTHIKWITDKETGKFYGSAFCEIDTPAHAADAVAKAGEKLLGRPIKVNFAPSRPGDVWPPPNKKSVGGGGGGSGIKAMSEKPENCVKLFVGNLSYDIDDDAMTKFFANVDAEVKAIRWLHHQDSGDFKGCGFVEFWKPEACEKGAALNGKTLLGRPIRIDWTD